MCVCLLVWCKIAFRAMQGNKIELFCRSVWLPNSNNNEDTTTTTTTTSSSNTGIHSSLIVSFSAGRAIYVCTSACIWEQKQKLYFT